MACLKILIIKEIVFKFTWNGWTVFLSKMKWKGVADVGDRHTDRTHQSSCNNNQSLLLGTLFYRGSNFLCLHVIGWGLSSAHLTGQWYVCIQDWMGLAGVLYLSLNPAHHYCTRGFVYFHSLTSLGWSSWSLLWPIYLCSLRTSCSCHKED